MIVILDVIKLDAKTFQLNKTWQEIFNLIKKGKIIWINDNYTFDPQNLYVVSKISKIYSQYDSKTYYGIEAWSYGFWVENADDYITFTRG